MSTTTATSSSRRTVGELIEARDPEFLAGCKRIADGIRESLEAVAHLEPGHEALEGEDPAKIRDALQRAWEAPAAQRPEEAPAGIDRQQFRDFLAEIGRDRGPLVVALFPPDPSKPCIHIPAPADNLTLDRIERSLQRQPELALGLVMNHPLPKSADWGSRPEHLNRAGKPRAWGASDGHISHAIGIWAECDGGLALEAQQALPQLAGLPEPSLRVWTGGKSLHLYWLVQPGEVLEPAVFKALQQRLAARLAEVAPEAKPDTGIHNPARLMRAPGGVHPKTGERCAIHSRNGQRFSVAQLLEMLPEPPATAAPATALGAPAPGLGDPVPVHELLPRDMLRTWEQGVPEADGPDGGRNSTAFTLACSLLAHHDAAAAAGLATAGTPEDALLQFASRCQPPLPDQEVRSVFSSACSAPRNTDPGWPERLRWQLNRHVREQRQQPPVAAAPAAPQLAAPAPAAGDAGPTGMPWLLDRIDTGTGPAGARKTTAGDLAQNLLHVAGDRLRFNQMTLLPEIDGKAVEGQKLDTLHVELQLRGMNITAEAAVDALATAALQRPYHPVREYLDQVVADPAIEPLDLTALVGQFLRPGDPPGTLQGRMLAKTLIGAVARAYRPGCKLDTACVLVGEQGAQKSTFWEALAGPDWYSSSSLGRLEKDSLLLVHATWFLEVAELETVTAKRAAGELKNFLSTRVDCFRPPYGKTMGRHQRPSVMVATSNRTDFLTDETGSRRFWIIPVTANEIDVAGVREIRDRIWKTAVMAYRRGERWWLDKADEAASEIENQQFNTSHPWEGPLGDWLGGWGSTPFTSAEALVRAGLRQKDQIQRRDEMALATVLGPMGWVQRRGRQEGERKRLWFRADKAPVPTVPTCPNLERGRSGRANTSEGNGSGELSRPSQPKNEDSLEAVPVEGTGTQRSRGTEKRSGRSGQGREPSQCKGSGVPTSRSEVGTRLGQAAEVGTEAPSTATEWAEAACEALRLAPEPCHLGEVHGWLQRHPDAPAVTKVQLATALERLLRDEADDQPDLFGGVA